MFHVRRGLLGLALVFVAAAAIAEEVGAVVDDSKPATYLVTVHADRTVTIAPFRVVRPGQGPPTSPPNVPPTNPPPGNNPSPFEAEIERMTRDVLSKGGTQTTGAALSSVYSLVADEVLAGRIEPASALPAIKAATNLVLAKQADAAAWAGWRTSVGDALTQLPLDTKEQMWAALRQVANGLNRATGFNVSPAELVKWDAGRLAVGKADGILDGIDLAQLVELIKLVMELIKLFQGFKP
jgi:hypothetical protein